LTVSRGLLVMDHNVDRQDRLSPVRIYPPVGRKARHDILYSCAE
jgi:hypothetical protein